MARYYQSRCELPGALETRVPSARSQAALAHLKVEGLRVRYIGPGEEDSQVILSEAVALLPSVS